MEGRLQVFTGNAHPALAEAICHHLETDLGRAIVSKFRNGETRVKLDENVRGADAFVIQSTSEPVNDYIMELLLMIDALRRASADRITAVIPYYGYAKQEKKTSGREPISAKLVANLLTTAGANRLQLRGSSISRSITCGQLRCWPAPFDPVCRAISSSLAPMPGVWAVPRIFAREPKGRWLLFRSSIPVPTRRKCWILLAMLMAKPQ